MKIKLYRCLVGVGKEEVDFSNFGVHYSMDESSCQSFGRSLSMVKMVDEFSVYEVEVDTDDINWPLTVSVFLNGEYEDEHEVILNTNVDLRIVSCDGKPVDIQGNTGISFERLNDETLPPEASEEEVDEKKEEVIEWIQFYQ